MSLIGKIGSLKKNSSVKNGALFSLFSFVNRGLAFFLLLILANYILPADYGFLSLFSTVVMVLGYFIAFSTDGYMTVAFFRDGNEGVKRAFTSIFVTAFFVCVVVLLGLSFWEDSLSKILDLPRKMLYLAVPICFFTLLSNVNLDLFRIREKVKIYGVFCCLNALLNFVLSIVLVKSLLMGWEGRVWAQFVCSSVFGFICLLVFFKSGLVGKFDFSYWKSMMLWGIPLIPHLSINFIRQGMDRYIINSSHGIESVGLFSFALNLANIIFMIGMGFNQSNSVEIYKVLGAKDLTLTTKKERLKRQRRLLLMVYVLATVVVSVACFIGVPVFLPKYVGALKFFPILAVYAFFYCCYLLYTNYLFFFKKTKNIMYVTFGSSLFHLLMSFLLTRFSLYYTCCVYCVSQLTIVVGIRYMALKTLEKSEDVENEF
jgi:O-antigen/teichoic acid export membrane protein